MISIVPISDIHVEWYRDKGKFLDELLSDLPDADMCVIAGDIIVEGIEKNLIGEDIGAYNLNNILKLFLDKYSDVVFVCGNHDYYNTCFTDCVYTFKDRVKPNENIHWLDNSSKIINDVSFYGGTLWFDDNYPYHLKKFLTDFKRIYPKQKFPKFVKSEHKKFLNGLIDNKVDVVVSHHALFNKNAILPEYMIDLSKFFYSEEATNVLYDLYQKNKQPKYWIHGHTHKSLTYELYGTQVICNCYGYPIEINHNIPKFNKDLILKV